MKRLRTIVLTGAIACAGLAPSDLAATTACADDHLNLQRVSVERLSGAGDKGEEERFWTRRAFFRATGEFIFKREHGWGDHHIWVTEAR